MNNDTQKYSPEDVAKFRLTQHTPRRYAMGKQRDADGCGLIKQPDGYLPPVVVESGWVDATEKATGERCREALRELVDTLDAHDVEGLDCDDRGKTHCDCVTLQIKKAKAVLRGDVE